MAQNLARVEGDLLVIPSKTALPKRCPITNAEVSDSEYRTWDLPYIPGWLRVWMFLGWFVLFFAPSIIKRRCQFKAGFSAGVRRRYFVRKLMAVAAIMIPVFLTGYGFVARSEQLTFIGFTLLIPCLWAGVIVFTLLSSPLKITRYEDGFSWIEGFSPDFLASLETPQKE